jgi:hypothetical protein
MAVGLFDHHKSCLIVIDVQQYFLDKLPLDGPVPEMADTNGPLSRQRLLLEAARRDKLTLWELCLLNAGPRGHVLVIGTPEHVADVMEHWFLNGAADGFNVMPAWLPGSLKDFVDLVIPERQLDKDRNYPGITADELPYGDGKTILLESELQIASINSQNITTITKTPPPEPAE